MGWMAAEGHVGARHHAAARKCFAFHYIALIAPSFPIPPVSPFCAKRAGTVSEGRVAHSFGIGGAWHECGLLECQQTGIQAAWSGLWLGCSLP